MGLLGSADFYVKLESVATAIGVLLTIAGLIYAGKQLRASRKISQGDFLLRLDEMFLSHKDVHVKLRPGGKWSKTKHGPDNIEEWAAEESYMGLFERIEILIENGVLDLGTVDRLYGYRIFNIVGNDIIRKSKLENERKSWEDFDKLWKAIDKRRRSNLMQRIINRAKDWYGNL